MSKYISVNWYDMSINQRDILRLYIDRSTICRINGTGGFYYRWTGTEEQLSAFILNNTDAIFGIIEKEDEA